MRFAKATRVCLVTAGLFSFIGGVQAENIVAEARLTKDAKVVQKDDPNLGEQLGKLMARKEKAVMAEDYLLAHKLKQEINSISNKEARKPSSFGFFAAFLSSISMIIVSEIGDKTFFIAAIMAMRNSRMEVFLAAISALAVMTVLSAALGFALPSLLPKAYTHYAASILFLFFGVKLLKDAKEMDPSEPNEEMQEVEEELQTQQSDLVARTMEGGLEKAKSKSILRQFFSPVFIQCFTMTFLAEWGDRSQIATIALAAAKNPYGVTFGGIIGHALCTGMAVMGGKLLATRISERTVAVCGGVLFLIFAAHSIYFGVEE